MDWTDIGCLGCLSKPESVSRKCLKVEQLDSNSTVTEGSTFYLACREALFLAELI